MDETSYVQHWATYDLYVCVDWTLDTVMQWQLQIDWVLLTDCNIIATVQDASGVL